jgi:hypothetical protein
MDLNFGGETFWKIATVLWRLKRSWENNIKLGFKEAGCEDGMWLELMQGHIQWWALVLLHFATSVSLVRSRLYNFQQLRSHIIELFLLLLQYSQKIIHLCIIQNQQSLFHTLQCTNTFHIPQNKLVDIINVLKSSYAKLITTGRRCFTVFSCSCLIHSGPPLWKKSA